MSETTGWTYFAIFRRGSWKGDNARMVAQFGADQQEAAYLALANLRKVGDYELCRVKVDIVTEPIDA